MSFTSVISDSSSTPEGAVCLSCVEHDALHVGASPSTGLETW